MPQKLEHLALRENNNSLWAPVQMLRSVADDIESGGIVCDKAVLVFCDSEAQKVEFFASGDTTRLEIAGLGAWLTELALKD